MDTTESADVAFGEALQKARATFQIDQERLIRLLNDQGLKWNQSTLSKVEGGKRPMRLSEAVILSGVLGISLDEFVHGEQAPLNQLRAARQRELDAVEAFITTRRARG